MPSFDSILSSIPEPDARVTARCQALLEAKTKSRGSLGRLEELARRFAALTGRPMPPLPADHPPPAR